VSNNGDGNVNEISERSQGVCFRWRGVDVEIVVNLVLQAESKQRAEDQAVRGYRAGRMSLNCHLS